MKWATSRSLGCLVACLSVASAPFVLGCATSFTGSARVPGGVTGCANQCEADGLEMGSFVYVGEYSTACVCENPNSSGGGSVGAGTAAAAGVAMQTRQQQQQQQ